MQLLELQRKRLDLGFIFKLLNSQVYYTELISSLSFLVPYHISRQLNTFYSYQSTDYGRNSPMNRVMKLVNIFNIDLFSCTTIYMFNVYLNNLIV